MTSARQSFWDNSSTDRRHGQQVIRAHSDIITKLVKLVVTLSVELEQLEEGKNHHGEKTQVTISRFILTEISMDHDGLPSAWARSDPGHTP